MRAVSGIGPTNLHIRRTSILTKRSLWLVVLLVPLASAALEIASCVRAFLSGEAFFNGRPTSYWSRELSHWFTLPVSGANQTFTGIWLRWPTRWEGWCNELGIGELLSHRSAELWQDGFPLSEGDLSAVPVLLQLLPDPDPNIRCIAVLGLARTRDQSINVQRRLAELIKDEDETVRTEAARALAAIQKRADW